jgi:hypothetical protein
VQTLAVVDGKLEYAIIGYQNDDVAGGVKHSRADLAVSKVSFDIGAYLWRESSVDVAGDVVPYMFAV